MSVIRGGVVGVCTKIGYTDSRDALYKIRDFEGERGAERLAPYVCPECGTWHIGHSVTMKEARKKRKRAAQLAGMGLDWTLLRAGRK